MLHKCRQRLSYHLDEGFLNSSGGREPLPQEYTGQFLMQIDVGLRGVSFGLHRVFIFKIVLVV